MTKPLADNEWCQWIFEVPGKPKRLSNFPYTREQAEAKWGPGWCEPDYSTREVMQAVRTWGLYPEGGGFLSATHRPQCDDKSNDSPTE